MMEFYLLLLMTTMKFTVKNYEANLNLLSLIVMYEDKKFMVKDVDESALIQVLNQLNPIVIIDESHNTRAN